MNPSDVYVGVCPRMGGIIEAVKNIPETLSYFLGVETLGLPPNFLTLTMLLCVTGLTET